MLRVIILGHGKLASGMKTALELIMGKQENILAVDYNEEFSMGDLRNYLEALIKSYEKNDEIILACDLFHGTPFNLAMELSIVDERIKVIYGINLNILIELVSNIMFSEDEIDFNRILETGKSAMGIFEALDFSENSFSEDEDEL